MKKLKMNALYPILAALFIISIYVAPAQNAIPLANAQVKDIVVYGKPVDNQTRCIHWHSELDIIAIKFKCCNKYYPCFSCHKETTDHKPAVWPTKEFTERAILCGICGNELTINEYINCNNTCPTCASLFNPGCKNHYHLYFETRK